MAMFERRERELSKTRELSSPRESRTFLPSRDFEIHDGRNEGTAERLAKKDGGTTRSSRPRGTQKHRWRRQRCQGDPGQVKWESHRHEGGRKIKKKKEEGGKYGRYVKLGA